MPNILGYNSGEDVLKLLKITQEQVMNQMTGKKIVVNLFTVNIFASLFGCTPADRASDSMAAPALKLLSKSVGA